MIFTADYHIHSRFSDGSVTLMDNVKAALRRGLTTIALTEHGPGHIHSGIRMKRIPAFLEEVEALNQQYAGQMMVKPGIEANTIGLGGEIDLPTAYEDAFEVVGLGYHRTVRGLNARSNAFFYIGLRTYKKASRKSRMTDVLIACMEQNRISFLAHPGQHTGPLDWERLAKACHKHNVAIEISARKGHLCFAPNEARAMRDCGAVFVVNSDSHDAKEIGEFSALTDFLNKAGLTHHDIVNAKGYDGTHPFGL